MMRRALSIIAKLLEYVSAGCLIIFCVTSFSQVIARYFGISFVWAEEVARFAFIYMVFTGCAVGVYHGTHYNFDVFGKMKNKLVSVPAHIISYGFQIFFFAFLLYTSVKFIPQMQARASSILRIPISVPYTVIVLFAGLSLVFVLMQTVDYLESLGQPDAGMSGEGK